MPDQIIHGKRPVFSASTVLEAIACALSEIKSADHLTYADIGAILGKSEDQAAKYCDASAAMDAVTLARGKREWNGRFTGYYDRLCVESRPAGCDREAESSVLKAALALSVALANDGKIDPREIRQNRAAIETARDALDGFLGQLVIAA